MGTITIGLFSAFLFSVGLAIVLTRKNSIFVLMGIELMLNAANLNFVAGGGEGEFYALFIIILAAAEIAIGLAIVVSVYRYFTTVDLDKIK